ncbi:MAG TPA: efflux RND transporter periplasmic adaptor subunit [Acetobacteraceae bacterium]|jgi:membrane fusion protein (multidrug efflux system)
MRSLAAGAVLWGLLASPSAWAQQPNAIPVGTVAAALRPITQATEFVGRVEAINRVEIRARVTGYLEDVLFKDGDYVKEGDTLYRIEPDSFQAAVQQAQGDLLKAQGNLANATAQLARTQELVKTDTASRALLDVRIADQKSAQGAVIIADANLKTANVNLGYTEITAPISGEIGRTSVTKGNVVSPDSGPLTVIVSRDPMYVTFPVSQRIFLTIDAEETRRGKGEAQALKVGLRFSNGAQYDQTGRIDFVNVQVDRATDTVLVRATIANPDGRLIDGQLVRVSVEGEKPTEKVLVPQSALVVDQQGPYVFLVVDGKAEVRRVKLGGESGPNTIVEEGLKGGEQVVVQGMETLRPGTPVVATPASLPQSQG